MDHEPIFDAHDNGGMRPKLSVVPKSKNDVRVPKPPLELHAAQLPDPCKIPPRRWLYGTKLIRGYVSVLVAPGGTGKSAYAMGIVLAVVTNRSFLNDNIFTRVNGAIFNLEDPMEELNRRLAALMIRHKVSREDIDGRLFMDDGEGRGLTMAEIGADGFTVAYPDEDALIHEIEKNKIGVVVCDPFAESHTLEENSNPQMVKAAAAWRRVARATNCAVLLVHHVRKGDATGIDAARGAKALTDSSRVGLLMSTMSEDDAQSFGINGDDRWQYVRLDDAKRNMAPAAKAKWFILDQVSLGNGTTEYPNGDKVAAIASWEPTNVLAATTPSDLNLALDRIRGGVSAGVLFTASKRGNSSRWAGQVLCDVLGITEKQAAPIISKWLRSGLLWEEEYEHPQWRRPTRGVRVNDNLRPT